MDTGFKIASQNAGKVELTFVQRTHQTFGSPSLKKHLEVHRKWEVKCRAGNRARCISGVGLVKSALTKCPFQTQVRLSPFAEVEMTKGVSQITNKATLPFFRTIGNSL